MEPCHSCAELSRNYNNRNAKKAGLFASESTTSKSDRNAPILAVYRLSTVQEMKKGPFEHSGSLLYNQ